MLDNQINEEELHLLLEPFDDYLYLIIKVGTFLSSLALNAVSLRLLWRMVDSIDFCQVNYFVQ